jgi:hypothetical protein
VLFPLSNLKISVKNFVEMLDGKFYFILAVDGLGNNYVYRLEWHDRASLSGLNLIVSGLQAFSFDFKCSEQISKR